MQRENNLTIWGAFALYITNQELVITKTDMLQLFKSNPDVIKNEIRENSEEPLLFPKTYVMCIN